ncbi:cell wall-binding repeat-containing protein [Bacillus salacetis]|uniref:cell wall-binding repeat-containing protein n=1 Tax=Bacillus salacetis TaxID=2315464 RepID=UPI003B9F9642
MTNVLPNCRRPILFTIISTLFLAISLIVTSPAAASGKTVERVSGESRYDTAIKVSQQGWPNGAKYVIIAVGDNFPDALAGVPLAKKYNAPILLVSKDNIPSEVQSELKRLSPSKAYILGGESAIRSNVDSTLSGLGIASERIAGKNRYHTAAKIANFLDASKAVVTYGQNFPDSLAIASYAANNTMPILLTEKNSVPAETKESLKKYQSTLVVGGTSVISNSVVNQLPNAKRVAGDSRYDTAATIVNELYPSTVSSTVVATGDSFADALTGSVFAAKRNAPVILVEKNNVPDVVLNTVEKANITNFTIIGGESAVSSYAQNKLVFNTDALVQTAKKYLGTPYKWGGTTPSGFDCSGYLMYVYGQHNISVARTTTDIWNQGTRVSQPAVGDIVVFETYKPGPSHVGMYIGNNEFIHSGNDGVEITSLSNSYWNPRYLGSVRVIK